MPHHIISTLRKQLKAKGTAYNRTGAQNFFKEGITLYGCTSKTTMGIANQFNKDIRQMSKEEVFGICEELQASKYHEESVIAANYAYMKRKFFEPKDISVFKRWIDRYISNWAECDTFCNHTVGDIVERFPQLLKEIKSWTGSKNRWTKRAAAVSLIIPAKKGLFLKEVFEISDILMEDPDDLVQKGYGWLLKVACNKHEKEVFDYVMKNKSKIPRTALRYAIEKMPPALKKKAMER